MAPVIVAGVVCLAWCLLAIWLGPRIGYVDHPGGSTLKTHVQPAVPLGGVGVFLGVHVAALVEGGLDIVLLAATGIVLVLGLIDDRRGLRPELRLAVELGAAFVLVMGVRGTEGGVPTALIGGLLVVFAINAVNLFDGLDGLAGSVGLVTALGLAWLADGRGLSFDVPLALAAALAAFLVFGWHPARVFLGDSGAYVIGLVLASVIIESSPDGAAQLVTTAGMLGLFAIDLVVTMVRRKLSGHPLFTGDRSHIYDQLRDRGWAVPLVAVVMAAVQAAIAVIVVSVDRSLDPGWALLVLAAVLIGLLVTSALLGFLRAAPH